jgi:N-acylglucosamine-6-phosphate 2-epimerase
VVALDGTERHRPGGEKLQELIGQARHELGAVLMADVASVAQGLQAAAWGCHWVGTTLYGYTEATRDRRPPAWDLLQPLRRELPEATPLICEGGIASADAARRALEDGADAVVVGTAITGVDLQVAAYRRAMEAGAG